MNIWKHLRFLQNMKVPWLVRVELDSWMYLGPFMLLCIFPFTIHHPFINDNRKMRRRNVDEVDLKTDDQIMSSEDVVEYYRSLGYEDPV